MTSQTQCSQSGPPSSTASMTSLTTIAPDDSPGSVVSGAVAIGSVAPQFELRDQNNQKVALNTFRGHKSVVVVFFPLAFTGTCEGELGWLRDHLPRFENDDCALLTISVGPPPTHKVWSSLQGFLFPMLSDFWPHGATARDYGVFNSRTGFANRGTFVVDRNGLITFSDQVGPGESRGADLWHRVLDRIGT